MALKKSPAVAQGAAPRSFSTGPAKNYQIDTSNKNNNKSNNSNHSCINNKNNNKINNNHN